jgi:hypothetical protein
MFGEKGVFGFVKRKDLFKRLPTLALIFVVKCWKLFLILFLVGLTKKVRILADVFKNISFLLLVLPFVKTESRGLYVKLYVFCIFFFLQNKIINKQPKTQNTPKNKTKKIILYVTLKHLFKLKAKNMFQNILTNIRLWPGLFFQTKTTNEDEFLWLFQSLFVSCV